MLNTEGLPPETVVFDLDGTLVDTAPDLTEALNSVLEAHARARLTPVAVRAMVGHGARALIEHGFAKTGPAARADEIPGLVALFLEHYGAHLTQMSRPFPGAVPLLEALARGGTRVGICTNKPEALSVQLLDELGLRHYFPVVLGADSLPVRKPHPGHLLGTIERLGGRPESTVMIGDSATDVETARAAHVPVIAVAFGYSTVPVEALGADGVVSHFDEIFPALARA
ncbi:MAG: phosphoglycolate phosphatase [Alphaproteobacteria bacterium]|nr:phosphoglycolate phosphatase [Alphaproteobacteria bacterium]